MCASATRRERSVKACLDTQGLGTPVFLTYCHRILLQDPGRSSTVVTEFRLHSAGSIGIGWTVCIVAVADCEIILN